LSSTLLFSHFFSYYCSVYWSTISIYELVVMIYSDNKAFQCVTFQTSTWSYNFIFLLLLLFVNIWVLWADVL
jgi:hypothetical protein